MIVGGLENWLIRGGHFILRVVGNLVACGWSDTQRAAKPGLDIVSPAPLPHPHSRLASSHSSCLSSTPAVLYRAAKESFLNSVPNVPLTLRKLHQPHTLPHCLSTDSLSWPSPAFHAPHALDFLFQSSLISTSGNLGSIQTKATNWPTLCPNQNSDVQTIPTFPGPVQRPPLVGRFSDGFLLCAPRALCPFSPFLSWLIIICVPPRWVLFYTPKGRGLHLSPPLGWVQSLDNQQTARLCPG